MIDGKELNRNPTKFPHGEIEIRSRLWLEPDLRVSVRGPRMCHELESR